MSGVDLAPCPSHPAARTPGGRPCYVCEQRAAAAGHPFEEAAVQPTAGADPYYRLCAVCGQPWRVHADRPALPDPALASPAVPRRPRPPQEQRPWARAVAGTDKPARTTWTEADRRKVLAAVRTVATRLPEFTADDVWAELDGTVPVTKGLTAVLVQAQRRGWIEGTGATRLSARGGQHDHSQRLVVWRSLIVDGAAA